MVSLKRQKELEKKHIECLLCDLHLVMSKLARQFHSGSHDHCSSEDPHQQGPAE